MEELFNKLEQILLNNYKINVDNKIQDELFAKKSELSQTDLKLNFSTTMKILELLKSIEILIANGETESEKFGQLFGRFLKMNEALNRYEILNEILSSK